MRKNLDYFILFLCGLGISLLAAIIQNVPGYMDASYSYAGALQLVNGKGFSEPFLWNYLEDPVSVIHPSHTYWMPLPSLVAAAGMVITGIKSYFTARLFFILLAALIPVLTAKLCYSLTGSVPNRIFAGLLALFPGFYLIFSTGTETFTLYMVLGTVFFLLVFPKEVSDEGRIPKLLIRYFLLGIVAGAMHLTRADGILWFMGAMITGLFMTYENYKTDKRNKQNYFYMVLPLVILAGYLLLMFPWYYRNITLFGSLFSPGGSHTIWLTEYDQTYIYPASLLTPQMWLNAGLSEHIKSWVSAFLQNIGTFIGVQGCVICIPLIIAGAIKYCKQRTVILGLGMWLMTLGVMTIVFPFAGARGGFYHSGAGVQPLLWSLVPVGLDNLISIGVRKRSWNLRSARLFFSAGVVIICAVITIFFFYQRVIGEDIQNPKWSIQNQRYHLLEQELLDHSVALTERVMVNDPPGYYLASERQAVAVPYGGTQTILDVAKRYEISYLLLEPDHPVGAVDLYLNPKQYPGFCYLETVEDTRIFMLSPDTACMDVETW